MAFTTSDKDAAATMGDINKALIGESFGDLVDGAVEYYANLPAASTTAGRIYRVQKRTANYWTLGVLARHLAGYYESNGTVWKFKPNSALPVFNYDGSDTSSTPNYRLFTPKDIVDLSSVGNFDTVSKELNLEGLAVSTANKSIDGTRLIHLETVHSDIQVQLDARVKANLGTSTKVLVGDGAGGVASSLITLTELDYLTNLNTNVKAKFTAIDAAIALKEPTVSASNRIPISHIDSGTVTATEFNYLDGVTGGIQSQINNRVDKTSSQTIAGSKTFSSKLNLHSAFATDSYSKSVETYTWFGSGTTSIGYVAGTTASAFSFYGDSRIAGSTVWAHSDERIKENIESIADALGILSQLRPASYNKIDRGQHGDALEYGFIAQEVEKVIPAAITKSDGAIPILKGSDEFTFEEGVSYGLIVELNGEYNDVPYTTGDELPEGRVFIHNQKVDDFRVVDYNMLSSITAQAVKELAMKVDDLQRQLDAK